MSNAIASNEIQSPTAISSIGRGHSPSPTPPSAGSSRVPPRRNAAICQSKSERTRLPRHTFGVARNDNSWG